MSSPIVFRRAARAEFDDVREALVPGYPYCVHYREEPGQVVVLSVFHTARDPATWQRRL